MTAGTVRTGGLMALTGAFYAASGPIAERAAAIAGVACRAHGFGLDCTLPADTALDPATYAISAAALLGAWVLSAVFLRERPVQPFIGLFAALGLGTIAYDVIVGRPLVTGERLINDTFDVLRFLIFASFALLLLVARRWTVSLSSVALAAATSFAAAVLSMVVFYRIRLGLIGAFELYLLYIAYAFGGFTLHLMTLSRLVAGARPRLGAGDDLHDLPRGEALQAGLAGRRRQDGGPRQPAADHAVHLRAAGVQSGEAPGVVVDIAAPDVGQFPKSYLAQAVAFRRAYEIGPGCGAGAEQNGQASQND